MKQIILVVVVALSLGFAMVARADKNLPEFKKGDAVYVCGCGDGCPCKTVSAKAGKCKCGSALEKTTVSKVEGDNLFATVKGKELSFPVKAKYACGCGEGCNCGTVSQEPGKCGCGKPLKKL